MQITDQNSQTERRQAERVDLARPCKLFDPRSGKYVSGLTWNISRGGVMLESSRPLDLAPGDRVYLGIAMKRRQALLLNQQMMPCEVMRSLRTTTEYTAVALRFLDETNVPALDFMEVKPQRRAA